MHPTHPGAPPPDPSSLPSPAPRPAAPPRPDHDPRLPTYAETQAASPSTHRFNRWGDWVDKRARERHRPDPSSSSPSSTNSPTLAPRHALAPHQDHLPTSLADSSTRPRSTSAASTSTAASAPGARSTLRLSRNSLLDRIGSRFDQGIPDEPLCAAPIPTSHAHDDRLILVGTAKGLYLVDLAPVSASAPLSTSARSPADARTHCLWHGIGVHQLEVHVEVPDAAPGRVPARSDARAPSGCVVALVDVANERQVRTWSLEALVSLAMWRTMDEHSVPLELDAAHFSPSSSRNKHAHHHHHQLSSSATSSLASPSTSLRHPTFPFLKTAHHSPSKDPRTTPETSSSSASSSAPASASASRRSLHLLDVDPPPAHGPPPPSAPSSSSAPAPSRAAAYLAQPLEWATSCAALSLPRGAGTVVSCRLFRMPPPLRDPARTAAPAPSSASPSSAGQWGGASSSSEEADNSDDDDSYDDEPSARVRAARERRRNEAHRVLLVVVGSARSVSVYEMSADAAGAGGGPSAGAGGWSWTLTREFFAPSTPRFLNLVRTTSPPAPTLVPLRATTSRPPPSSSYTGPAAGPPYPPDLHLVLGTSHRVVLVSLATSAVHEVDVPLEGASSRRARASSAASSRSETALGSSAGSSALGHRKTPSRAAAAAASAALGLGELRKSLSALVGGGSSGGRGAGPAPAGMDERELEGLVAGRRVDEGQVYSRQGARYAELARETERARWTGCDVVAVHGPRARTSRSDRLSTSPTRRRRRSSALVFLTRGSTSYLVPSLPCPAPLGAPDPPLGLDRSPSSSSASSSPTGSGAPDPLALDVRHTLHHALAPVRRVVALVPPPSGAGSSGAGRADAVPLVVCAFAETGLAVQEWGVSPDARLVAAPARAVARVEQQQQLGEGEGGPSAQEEEEEDDPPPDAATLDFARATRFLCELGGEGTGLGTHTEALFAVEGRGEWVLHRLGVRP
ncbi:hypothetical protein JCM9279_006883 [Rhodotorula babjevae]